MSNKIGSRNNTFQPDNEQQDADFDLAGLGGEFRSTEEARRLDCSITSYRALSIIFFVKVSNTRITLCGPNLADVSKNGMFMDLAKSLPRAAETCRLSFSRSTLLPTRTKHTDGSACSRIALNQRPKFSKEGPLVMS
eukprot:c19598_g1_i3.p1 GENE.c19598_g1_i3~~c19598_g1_i3.p1  ORF type:complete len:137 (-),score=7.33 c19598_g1_i3:163-573(-)